VLFCSSDLRGEEQGIGSRFFPRVASMRGRSLWKLFHVRSRKRSLFRGEKDRESLPKRFLPAKRTPDPFLLQAIGERNAV